MKYSLKKLLLTENQQFHEKIVDLILTGDLANINQALELALTMGYVTDLQHSNPYTQNRSLTKHKWKMEADPGFEAEIKKQYKIDFKSISYGIVLKK